MRIDETKRGNNLFPHIDGWAGNQFVWRSNLTKASARLRQPPSRHGTFSRCLKKSDDSHYGVISLVVTTGPWQGIHFQQLWRDLGVSPLLNCNQHCFNWPRAMLSKLTLEQLMKTPRFQPLGQDSPHLFGKLQWKYVYWGDSVLLHQASWVQDGSHSFQ